MGARIPNLSKLLRLNHNQNMENKETTLSDKINPCGYCNNDLESKYVKEFIRLCFDDIDKRIENIENNTIYFSEREINILENEFSVIIDIILKRVGKELGGGE